MNLVRAAVISPVALMSRRVRVTVLVGAAAIAMSLRRPVVIQHKVETTCAQYKPNMLANE